MRIDPELKLGFKDVLIRPKRSTISSRSEVELQRTFILPHSRRSWTGIPILAANMDGVGTFAMARALAPQHLGVVLHKHYSLPQWRAFLEDADDLLLQQLWVSCGASEQDLAKLSQILALDSRLGYICIDVANGYSQAFIRFVTKVREKFPQHGIAAGNTVTGEITEQLILSGADVVKIGVGPGSVCTTRLKTGVGYPQLSAIIECADAAHGLGGLIISDGGCRTPGDVAKALGAGADFTMLGGMLAAHDESESEVVEHEGQKWVQFYGMSSSQAMEKHGGVADYRTSEGKLVRLPYRGPVDLTLGEILGGLRSACSYVGARKLKEFSKRTTFIRVTEQENTVFN